MEDRKLIPSLNSEQFGEYDHFDMEDISIELSEFILDTSTNNRIENRHKMSSWTDKYSDDSSFFKRNQSDEIELCDWEAITSELLDINLEFSNSNTGQSNELFFLQNFKSLGSESDKTNQLINIRNENNQMTKGRESEVGHLSTNCEEDDSDTTFLETTLQCYSDAFLDIDSYHEIMESVNSDDKDSLSDTPDNCTSTDHMNNIFSEDRQSLLEVLDNSVGPFFCQGISTPSDQDEIGRLRSFTKNFFEIVSPSEQGNTGVESVTKTDQSDMKERDQANDRPLSRNVLDIEDIEENVASLAADLNEHNRLKTNCYRRNHREHVNYLQRKRVKRLNHGYKCLQAALPTHLAKQKLSKLEILLQAIKYIGILENILKSCEMTC